MYSFVNITEYLSLGYKLENGVEVYDDRFKYLGDYVGYDDKMDCVLLENATYSTFPISETIMRFKVPQVSVPSEERIYTIVHDLIDNILQPNIKAKNLTETFHNGLVDAQIVEFLQKNLLSR